MCWKKRKKRFYEIVSNFLEVFHFTKFFEIEKKQSFDIFVKGIALKKTNGVNVLVAKVVGTVVCTQKDDKLVGSKLQVVVPLHAATLALDGKPLVAVDAIGAGVGEVVLIVSGSSARQTSKTKDTPVDAVIMAIVDSLEMDGKLVYRKAG